MALITTMLLGFVAIAIVAALMTFMIYGKKTSVIEERYTSALEAAKGAANYLMNRLETDQYQPDDDSRVQCYGETTSCPCWKIKWNNDTNKLECPDGNPVDKFELGSYSNIGDYQIDAFLLHKDTISAGYDIYAIRIISIGTSKPEKAEIDFIYRVSPPSSP
ncbi:hypothetical protein [Persephonella sp.]